MASSGNSNGRGMTVRFTEEQIASLETLFIQFPNPSVAQRREMKRMVPVLSNLDDTQLKIWFANRRREDDGVDIRERLILANRVLKKEHAALVRKVSELQAQNDFLHEEMNP